MNNLKQGLMEKFRLAKHAYEEGHRIQWKEAKDAQIETNKICRKYKGSGSHGMYHEAN
jgi:hypothetical protein